MTVRVHMGAQAVLQMTHSQLNAPLLNILFVWSELATPDWELGHGNCCKDYFFHLCKEIETIADRGDSIQFEL